MFRNRSMYGLSIVLVAGLFSIILGDAEIKPGSEKFTELCVTAFKKFDEIKSQHGTIKSLIDDNCVDEYMAMRAEVYPIAEKFLAGKPDDAALTNKCKSEEVSNLFNKHMKVFVCLKKLVEEYGAA